ncbi:stage III sporulation protein AA [Anaerosalibacter sp. Marseille-P3206]|uniref:stage III sporulation protein AA n=1 Tax=Anaerosalibacter sp. Marseille-P3206 TaxID=1871005 RepID=UPI000987D06A|nr:stage III sporulation protein AA [Anaerosalibacter sp. Marseille-P3206]
MEKCNSMVFDKLLEYLVPDISNILYKISDKKKDAIEEIRLKNNMPIIICCNGFDYFVSETGQFIKDYKESVYITKEQLQKTFQIISNYSVYAFEEEIKSGFITLKGGHRVGLAGKVVYGPNGIETIKNISSLNLRIAHEITGVSNNIMKYILKQPNTIYNTLIISPPQCGKTTLLRDIVRNISDGMPRYGFNGLKVGLVDERSEIAGVYNGIPQNNVGLRTDILDGCLKSDGIIILIRAMSPDVIATDELGSVEDIVSIHEALKTGVKLISTVHGDDLEDVFTKKNLDQIIKEKIFRRIIILDNSKGVGTIRDILDGYTFRSIFH